MNRQTRRPAPAERPEAGFEMPEAGLLDRSAGFFRSLANPTRLMILLLLKKRGELSVQNIHQSLNISQPLASQHLKTLKQQGLLEEHRHGKQVMYGLKAALAGNAFLGLLQAQSAELAANSEAINAMNELLALWVL
ncbi:MAG: ArsR/SmtB family transcription factor [Candidatus Melainabacteria bacterium]